MKYVDEFRAADAARALASEIARCTTRPWTIMEICGGQTHTIVRFGLEELLPASLRLLHGPGCPVCVTPLETIDRALALAALPEVIFTSFGDMLRVPGSVGDLLSVKARGGDVRMVYSPLDAVNIARQNPERHVVFFAVGFETTAPANAMAAHEAKRLGLANFSLLCSQVLVPPAVETILASPDCAVQGFLAAGHVCTVMGTSEYQPIAARHRVPITVTGFEPVDILQGILLTVRQLEAGTIAVENQYARAVRPEGNVRAKALLAEVFEVCDKAWRGIGVIPRSGYRLHDTYAHFDAERRFDVSTVTASESPLCIAGSVLQGLKIPSDCSAFASLCTPEHPLGAPMVSGEGACAAYFRYRGSTEFGMRNEGPSPREAREAGDRGAE